MALKIRLARAGSKKRPYYHIVVADVRAPRDGRFIEKVGNWNPMLPKDAERVTLDKERIEHWLKNGARPTDRVSLFLGKADILKHDIRNNPSKALPGKKAQERIDAAKAAAEEAAAQSKQKQESQDTDAAETA